MGLADLAALVFRVGDTACAIASSHVVETMRPLPVIRLDRMPPFVRGVATIRGVATPVVDVAALLGRSAHDSQRFVTVRAGARVVALAVGDVVGLARFAASDLRDRPPLLSGVDDGIVRSLAVRDAALYLVLDSARIVEATRLDS
jgi:purine-binding chemotaxis protein CheW